jgi:hypothetical protein
MGDTTQPKQTSHSRFTPHSLYRNLTGTTTHLKVIKVSTHHRCEQSARTSIQDRGRRLALSATLELLKFAGGAAIHHGRKLVLHPLEAAHSA